jgi:Family of unknown function (DUF6356)
MDLRRLFTEHPDSAGESYFEHMKVALSFALPLAAAAFAALVHASLPFCFEKTASAAVRRLYTRMTSRQPRPSASANAADRLLGWDPVI